jgi:SAM-dependent methyltransferase
LCSVRRVIDEGAEANAFGQAASGYERSRPGYPDEVVDWLIPQGAEVALDLGAGTGKLSQALARRGLEVVAVDPSAEMLAVLAEEQPGVRTVVGEAERIPLPSASMDLVTVGQAWHWVDESRALAEVARVLRPGGTLALIWNLRDERVEWMRRLGEIVPRKGAEPSLEGEVEIGPPFGATERFELDWSRPMDLEQLLELVGSLSPVIVASEAERAAILDSVRRAVRNVLGPTGSRIDFPYRTRCFRARLASGPA